MENKLLSFSWLEVTHPGESNIADVSIGDVNRCYILMRLYEVCLLCDMENWLISLPNTNCIVFCGYHHIPPLVKILQKFNLSITEESVDMSHMFPLRPFGPKLGNISRFFYAASRLRKTFSHIFYISVWNNYIGGSSLFLLPIFVWYNLQCLDKYSGFLFW